MLQAHAMKRKLSKSPLKRATIFVFALQRAHVLVLNITQLLRIVKAVMLVIDTTNVLS